MTSAWPEDASNCVCVCTRARVLSTKCAPSVSEVTAVNRKDYIYWFIINLDVQTVKSGQAKSQKQWWEKKDELTTRNKVQLLILSLASRLGCVRGFHCGVSHRFSQMQLLNVLINLSNSRHQSDGLACSACRHK